MLVSRNSICSRLKYCSSFFLVTQHSLSLPALSRKIKGLYQILININFFKDRSFEQYLVLDVLTNPVRVTLTKKGNILGKNPLPISLFLHTTL